MNRSDLAARAPLCRNFVLAVVLAGLAHVEPGLAATRSSLRPSISGSPPLQATVGQAYSFTPTATAPRSRSLWFTINHRPSWTAFSNTTGALSGTPASANVGRFSNIVITAHDGFGTASLPAFSITVAQGSSAPPPPPPPAAPVISGSPATSVTAGAAYSFTPTASDPSGKTLAFSIQNKPAWSAFSIANGALTGTPTAAQAGTYSNIVITASDGSASASLKAFNITVTAPAASGVGISGTPAASVTAGSAYTFTPTTSDPGGGTLSFSVQNKPSWATFSVASGLLSGTPVAANIGSYSGIVISVSNGTSSAALPAFAIAVNAAAGGTTTGSVTIAWTPPTQNTDGSPLSDLAGYHIYYGTSPANLSSMAAVANASATSVTIGNLSSATWYFGIKSYTTSGTESALSNVGSTTVP